MRQIPQYSARWLAVFIVFLSIWPVSVGADIAPGPCEPVYLDVGHSAKRFGATSARGQTEYSFNKRFAFELASALTSESKYKVEIISGKDKDLSLKQRAEKIGSLRTGILLSIHHDSVQPIYIREWFHEGKQQRYSDKFSGFSLFTSGLSPAFHKSVMLAGSIGQSLVAAGFAPTLHHAEPIPGESRPLLDEKVGLYRFDGLAVLKNASIPAVLIEVGVIVNRAEEERLNDPAHRAKIKNAILLGLNAFCQ